MTTISSLVQSVICLNSNIIELKCTPSEIYNFKAGQYAFLQTKDMSEPRAYSIATSEKSKTLTFHIRTIENSPTSQSFMALKPNDKINISASQGNNILDTNITALVLIAGGVGIAPLYSMIMTAYKHQPTRKIILYWGVDTKEDLYLNSNFIKLSKKKENFTYIPICLEPNSNILEGLVTDYISNDKNLLQTASIHIAGPKKMMLHTIEIMGKYGINEENISYDKFW